LVTYTGTGSTIALSNSTVYLFTAGTGTLILPSNAVVDYLIVGGGGGGGGVSGGGGGAGGLIYAQGKQFIAGTYTWVVGAGGAGGADSGTVTSLGSNGVSSSLSSATMGPITAVGGGGGAGQGSVANALSGGSGGGGHYAGTGASGTTGQGTSGGNGYGSAYFTPGGGGGAAYAGEAGQVNRGGNGGGALQVAITGSIVNYAGGGGGGGEGVHSHIGAVYGGTGGGSGSGNAGTNSGGNGSIALYSGGGGPAQAAGTVGVANTGGGGGGGADSGSFRAGYAGGSGIVVVRVYSSAVTTATGDLVLAPANGNTVVDGQITFASTGVSMSNLISPGGVAQFTLSGNGVQYMNLTNGSANIQLSGGNVYLYGSALLLLNNTYWYANIYMNGYSIGNVGAIYAAENASLSLTASNGVSIGGNTSAYYSLYVASTTLGTTATNTVNKAEFYNTNANNSYVRLTETRESAGNNWFTAYTRLRQFIDTTGMGYLQFNGVNNPNGASIGTSSYDNTLVVKDSGRVGIATWAPTQTLDVNGTLGFIDSTSTQRYATYSYNNIWFLNPRSSTGAYNSIDGLAMDSNGKVGIKTSSPAYTLDVTGTIRATAGLVFGVQAV